MSSKGRSLVHVGSVLVSFVVSNYWNGALAPITTSCFKGCLDHHCLSCNDPLLRRCRTAASPRSLSLWRHATHRAQCVLYRSSFSFEGHLWSRSHERRFSWTYDVHSGVYHDGSDGLVVSRLLGMCRCIPSSIVSLTLLQAKLGSLEMILLHSTSRQNLPRRPKSASLYRHTRRDVRFSRWRQVAFFVSRRE